MAQTDELELEPSNEPEQRDVRSVVECAGLQAVIRLAVRRIMVGVPVGANVPISVGCGYEIEPAQYSTIPVLVSRLRVRANDRGLVLRGARVSTRCLDASTAGAGIPIDGVGLVWRFAPVLLEPGSSASVRVYNASASVKQLVELTWWGVEAKGRRG